MRVVKIGAIWCSACLVMNKTLKNVLPKYNLEVEELDYDMDSEEVLKYNPNEILPVVIFFNGSQEVHRVCGELSEKELINIIDSLVIKYE